MSADEPIVALLATIEHEAVHPGFCGRCLQISEARRSRLRLYADVRPAALAHAAQRTQTSALLCRHYARKQAQGEFAGGHALLLCPACLAEDLRSLGLTDDPLEALATAEADDTETNAEEAQRYALFVHLPEGLGGRSIAALSTLPPDMDLAEVLAEERAEGVPPRTPTATPDTKEQPS